MRNSFNRAALTYGTEYMGSSRSILFVTSEVAPFVKTGGLADVSAALPLALVEMGHDVRIIAPKYGNISERRNRIHEIKRLKDIPIVVNGKETMATVKSSQVVNSRSKVQVYLVTSDEYFEPFKGAYVNPKTGKDFANNDERFIFFQKSAIETCFRLGWKPDIIHCNDWQTGLIPAFVRELYTDDEFFAETKTIFTIHNLAYQGEFPKESFDKTGLDASLFTAKGVAHEKKLNMMKAGIQYADAVTTVSPQYAREILKKDHGEGLDGVLRKVKDRLFGILNGIDTEVWNPSTDRLIDEKYDAGSLVDKFDNKKALAKAFGFRPDEGRPVICMIARMVEQKGYELIIDGMDRLQNIEADFVIMGEGSGPIPKNLEKKTKKAENVHVKVGYDEDLAHLMFAGSDFVLMPSKYEPCGLNQFYGMAYGAVPIVRSTGGLSDAVEKYNAAKGTGDGFVFRDFTAESMIETIEEAVSFFENDEAFEQLQKKIMERDNSWSGAARRFTDEVYAQG